MRYVVYDPKDPRKGRLLPDPELGQIILGEGKTITDALKAAPAAPHGAVVWDRSERRVAYTVPERRIPSAERAPVPGRRRR
jgi:hypothetical protein